MAVTTVASGDLKCLIRAKTEIPVIKLAYDYVTRLIAGLKVSGHGLHGAAVL